MANVSRDNILVKADIKARMKERKTEQCERIISFFKDTNALLVFLADSSPKERELVLRFWKTEKTKARMGRKKKYNKGTEKYPTDELCDFAHRLWMQQKRPFRKIAREILLRARLGQNYSQSTKIEKRTEIDKELKVICNSHSKSQRLNKLRPKIE